MSYEKLPEKYRDGIRNWIEFGIEPGGFLCAVLKNDFGQAVQRADECTTFEQFLGLRRFLYNNAPPMCSGSTDCFDGWPGYRSQMEGIGRKWDADDGCWNDPELHVVT